ncbi:hypothetical protein GCM10009789_49030 [Kribbella sancticallisti]|uniref:Uncharacterized protein n=1 Tax=Kribbella sancticallisti TaxID=460087 RepID=A0ABN2DXD0_9ACTN
MKSLPARKPVFVDSSGHRHRAIRRLGVLLAVPVVGYVVLLVSSVVGGPRVDTPLIPLPEAGKQQPARVTPAPGKGGQTPKPSEPSRTPESSLRPVAEVQSTPTPGESATPSTKPTTPTPSDTPTGTPTPTSTPSQSTTPTGTPTPGHGKPSTPPGRTKSPSKP